MQISLIAIVLKGLASLKQVFESTWKSSYEFQLQDSNLSKAELILSNLQLNTIWAEGLDVGVVEEGDAPEVDDPQVGGGLLQDLDVEDLVHFALFLLSFLVGAVDVQHLQTVDETGN